MTASKITGPKDAKRHTLQELRSQASNADKWSRRCGTDADTRAYWRETERLYREAIRAVMRSHK